MSSVLKIITISDTHNKHEFLKIPNCDILIHAGDATAFGTIQEFFSFITWFSNHTSKIKIYVPGNHCLGFSNQDRYIVEDMFKQHNIIVLNNQEFVHDGIKFYGSPYSLKYGRWAFMKEESDLKNEWEKIPLDTQILIVHGPPYKILDSIIENKLEKSYDEYYFKHNVGSVSLAEKINEIKPSMVVFGHIHEQGNSVIEKDNILYMNASCLNGSYQVRMKHFIQTYVHYENIDGKANILYIDYVYDTQDVRK